MSGDGTIGEFVAGVQGLALLRLAVTEQGTARSERLAELRELVGRLGGDASLDIPAAGREHDLDDGYRVWSHTYDQPLRLFPIEAPPVHRRIDELSTGVVLDAACGSGRHSQYLADIGHEVIGVDRSEAMLDLARTKVPAAGFLHGELAAIPLLAASMDAVVCALALVHVVDLDAVFAEFARVVRVGGRLIVSDVHPMLVALGWQAQFPDVNDGRGFIRLRHHLISDYVAAAARHGFALHSCEEPPLTADAARTPAGGLAPEACEQAFAGLPAAVVFDFRRA